MFLYEIHPVKTLVYFEIVKKDQRALNVFNKMILEAIPRNLNASKMLHYTYGIHYRIMRFT